MWGEPPSWQKGLPAAASLAVNALLAAALLSLGLGRASEDPAGEPAMTVVSFAAVKGADDGDDKAETAEPSEPTPAPQAATAVLTPAPAQAQMLVEKAAVAAPVALMPSRSALTEAQTAAPAAAAQQSAAQAAAAAPASAAQARKGAADGLDVRAPSGDGRSYAARIRSWLYAHKTYPRRARMRREEGIVQVRFTVDRAGMLLEGAIIRGSGNGALDEEAMATLRRASPFPKAPREVVGERIEFTVPIEFALTA